MLTFAVCFWHIRLGVSDTMLQPFLEGWPLHQVIEAKRLFMVDLEILQDLPCKSDDFVVTVIFNLYFLWSYWLYLIRFVIFSSI